MIEGLHQPKYVAPLNKYIFTLLHFWTLLLSQESLSIPSSPSSFPFVAERILGMLSRKALILLFKLFRYLFSMRLCAFWRLQMGDFARGFSDWRFRGRTVGFFASTSPSASHGELDSELLGDEAKLGVEMVVRFSEEGLLYRAGGVLVLFSKAVAITQGSMNDFWSNPSSTVREEAFDIGDGSPNWGRLEELDRLNDCSPSRPSRSSKLKASGLSSVPQS